MLVLVPVLELVLVLVLVPVLVLVLVPVLALAVGAVVPIDGTVAARMPRRATPRLAGRRLLALARLLDTPGVGRRLAELVMRDRLLGELDRRDVPDAEMRPVIAFRPAPRRPVD